MIIIKTDKIYSLYVRTNRRVRWRYSEYGGAYATIEEAIAAAKKHFDNTPFEYLIENTNTNETINGSIGF